MKPTADDIKSAAKSIQGDIIRTPTMRSLTLSQICGASVFLKFENQQFTASFKERGALWKLQSLTEQERKQGVIAMSRGNHAQGVAYHAKRLGIPSTIVMPSDTPITKVVQTEDFGARVVLFGQSLSDAEEQAKSISSRENLVWIHPYDDAAIIAGQGTVGMELIEDAAEVDTLVVPIGGGGLLSGMALAARSLKPDVRIYGVQAEMYPSMFNVFNRQSKPCGGPTIAEGIAVATPGQITRELIGELIDDVLLVSERNIERAIALFVNVEKTVAEGAGAAGLAALLQYPDLFTDRTVGLPICGGNIDSCLLAYVLLRELAREGRLVTVRIESQDQPGFLGRITTEIGKQGGNIIDVSHNRLLTALPAKSADIRLTIETRDLEHGDRLILALKELGLNLTRIDEVHG